MEVKKFYINVGLGDLFYYAQIYDLYRDNIKYSYMVEINFLKKYRSEKHIIFITNFFKFFDIPIEFNFNPNYNQNVLHISPLLKEFPINNLTLQNYFKNNIKDIVPKDKYIIINVTIRSMSTNDISYMLKVANIIKQLEFQLPIILLGDKKTRQTSDTTNFSIYNYLDITNTTKYIDLTQDSDLLNNLNFELIQRDIVLMMKAEESFCFGFGGSFCLNTLFAKKLSAYFDYSYLKGAEGFFSHFYYNFDHIKLYKNINDIINQLKNYKKLSP